MARRGRRRAFDRLPRCLQRVSDNEGRAFFAMLGEPPFKHAEIVYDQRALVLFERLGASVANIDCGRANVAEASLARSQAKIGILEIAGSKIVGQWADLVETGAGYVQTKTDPARDVDNSVCVKFGGNPIDPLNVFTRTE